jgi:hypothetical protein
MGVLASESLFLHRIAEGLSDTRGTNKNKASLWLKKDGKV